MSNDYFQESRRLERDSAVKNCQINGNGSICCVIVGQRANRNWKIYVICRFLKGEPSFKCKHKRNVKCNSRRACFYYSQDRSREILSRVNGEFRKRFQKRVRFDVQCLPVYKTPMSPIESRKNILVTRRNSCGNITSRSR